MNKYLTCSNESIFFSTPSIALASIVRIITFSRRGCHCSARGEVAAEQEHLSVLHRPQNKKKFEHFPQNIVEAGVW